MRTFMVRDADGQESEAKQYEAHTPGGAAERFASDAYFARMDRNVDAYELLVTRDDGKVYEITVDVEVEVHFDALINGSPAGDLAEH